MKADQYASWLLLEASQQGRPVEFHAQGIASMHIEDDIDDLIETCLRIIRRAVELRQVEDREIWPWLMPGSAPPGDFPMEHPAVRLLEQIKDLLGEGWDT